MGRPSRYSPEVRERAVRMVFEHQREYDFQWAAMSSIASNIGCAAETFWTQFLRSLTRRGLRGVKLVISDSHEGIQAAIPKVLTANCQRCRVHFLRNALAYVGKGQRQMVRAAINTIFAQDTPEAASRQWRIVADQLREKFPKLAALMDDAETDVLAFMNFPKAHRTQIYSTNPLERLNAEVKRRTRVVGIFPNDPAIVRLVGALLLEQNDDWQIQRRYSSLKVCTLSATLNRLACQPSLNEQVHSLPTAGFLHHAAGRDHLSLTTAVVSTPGETE